MSKQRKEKPSYNVWQNVCFMGRHMLRSDKKLGLYMFLFVAAGVASAVAGLFLPQTVVKLLESGAGFQELVLAVLAFSAVIGIAGGLTVWVTHMQWMPCLGQRLSFINQQMMKNTTTDYSNLGRESYQQAMEKANASMDNNDSAAEEIFRLLEKLGVSILCFVIYLVLLTKLHPLILLLVAFSSVTVYFLRRRVNQWRHDNDKEAAEPGKRLWYLMYNSCENKYAKDVRLFGLESWLEDIWQANKKLLGDFQKKVYWKKHLTVDIVDAVLAFLREGAAYAYLIYLVLFRELPVDQFVLLFAAIGGFSAYITNILEQYATLHRFSLDICRLREFLDFPAAFCHDGTQVPKYDSYEIQLRDVSFRYEGAKENTLEHINLTIRPGEKLAVVGLNGAGKTTLIQLICGLYDPTEGEVLLNGVNIKKYDRNEYYKQFAAVFQDFSILPYSIAQNVASVEEEAIDYPKVRRCLELADIADKVDSLPEKEHSLLVKSVNENAAQLSGGETQRLMLARALYKDAPILLLDEPTAALDPIAESRMYEHYDALSQGKTAVYISHRLASTFFCDRIILIADKGIAEEGTHAQLMALNGKYANLFNIQSHYYKEHPEGGEPDEKF